MNRSAYWTGTKIIVSIFLLADILIPVTDGEIPLYNMSISLDISKNLIKGISTITFSEDREIKVSTGNLEITSVKLNGLLVDKGEKIKINGKGVLEIDFEGTFKGGGKENLENIGIVSEDIISEDGISLTGTWYPQIEGRAYYSLKAVLPKDFLAISEADDINVIETSRGMEHYFNFSYPVDRINLAAGRYMVLKDTVHGIDRDIDIYVYTFSKEISDIAGYLEDFSRSKTYIEHSERYIKMYEELLGPYPYKRFSVVENILPTGYSMPTFTLLGSDVMKLPFIVETSLGHEILHQWFGNYVYNDYENGNWIEGITTYLSDHLFEKQKGDDEQYRKNILLYYQDYVRPDKEIDLEKFSQRNDFSSESIGYGKGMMLFHMLNKEIGEDAFYRGLKKLIKEKALQETTWNDIRIAFEQASGRNLEYFFDEWLYRKGVISIEIKDSTVVDLNGVPTISFKIIQKDMPYKFNVSVKIITDKGEKTEILKMKNESETFEISSNETPLEMIFDSSYDLMRRLSEKEYPHVIAKLLGDEDRIVVIPEKDKERYKYLIDIFKDEGFSLIEEKEIKDENITTSSLLILGEDSPIIKRLFGEFKKSGSGFSLTIRENPLNSSKVIAVVQGDSKEDVELASKKISHYGKYSFIRFEKGKNVEKKTEQTENGIRISLYKPVLGIQPQKTIRFEDIITNISNKTIIYVGEIHSGYEEHKVELDVIKNLYKKSKDGGYKLAIGMEMFEKQFQNSIDDYASENITEKEFLKRSQYFNRWKYDYNLYREIVNFAKFHKIPIIALNLRSEIVKNVSRGGLDILSDQEKKEIPKDMDMSDNDYKQRLKDVFGEHEDIDSKNFNYFYQSQILWDETMAHSIDEFLEQNPDYHIVVLAGIGHITYGSGIPKRTYRLNAKDYAILIQGSDFIDKDIGNYVLLPEPIELPPVPRLGIFFNETNNTVKITNIENESVAEKAGLKKDDIFISINNWKIESAEDIRISIFDKKKGDTIKIKTLRKLVGKVEGQEVEIVTTL